MFGCSTNQKVLEVDVGVDRRGWTEGLILVAVVGLLMPYWGAAEPSIARGLGSKAASRVDTDVIAILLTLPRIAVALHLMRLSGRPWQTFGLVRFGNIDWLIGAVAFTIAHVLHWTVHGVSTGQWVLHLVTGVDGGRTPKILGIYGMGLGYALLYGVGLLISALSEEIILRSYLITALSEAARSRLVAVLVTALIYAGYHLNYGLDHVVGVLLNGVSLGLLFIRFRRLWPLVLAHAAYNISIDFLG